MATGEEPPRGAPADRASAPPLRIGHAERTAAIKALDEHLTAGRLGVDEYADRTAAATDAVVAADLATLFTDLPEPHPPLPHNAATPSQHVGPPGDPATPEPSTRAAWAPRVVPVAVVVAILLFLVLRQGAVFVLIPLAAVLFWGLQRR